MDQMYMWPAVVLSYPLKCRDPLMGCSWIEDAECGCRVWMEVLGMVRGNGSIQNLGHGIYLI